MEALTLQRSRAQLKVTTVETTMPKLKPTIDDVARLAGVSTATVSRTLNAPDRVRAPTVETVRNAVDTLGYTPHFGGRALASNKTNTIGAVIPTMENAIFARGLQAMQERLAEAGVTLLVATSDYDPEKELEQIRALISRGIDGLMLIGFARPKKTYALLASQNVSFVTAWNYNQESQFRCVGFDNRAAINAPAEHLISGGHKRIAMISGVMQGNDRATERVEGVRDALARHNLDLPSHYLVEVPYELEAAKLATEKIMANSPRPTAIVCGNDVIAAGALIYARNVGIRVPEDVSVTGFDDLDLAVVVDPPLATVHVPHREMGRTVAEMLLKTRDGEDGPVRLELDTQFVVRESVGPAPKDAK